MDWRRIALQLGAALLGAGVLLACFAAFSPESASGLHTLIVLAFLGGLLGLFIGSLPDKLITIFIIPELRQKILLTILFLAIYRVGYHIPLPFADQRLMYRNVGGSGPLGN